MPPVAYLRRSSAGATDAGHGRVSFDTQRRAVIDLAARYGEGEPELLVEWGVSGAARSGMGVLGGTRRGGRRRAYHDLRDRIEAGRVSSLYAYSLSRLARSTRELLDLAEICVAHGVPIRLAKEGEIDGTSPHGRLYLTVLAAVATFEAEVASERGKDRNASMRERGAHVGRPPFGWQIGPDGVLVPDAAQMPVVDRVLRLHETLESPMRVAKALNREGIASPFGGRWADGTVRRILARQPGARLPATIRGSRAVPVATFARLLVCACGGRLTPSRKRYLKADGTLKDWTGYTCSRARFDPAHARRRAVAEAAVLSAVQEELTHLVVPDRVAITTAAESEQADIAARRERVLDALENGTMTRLEADSRLAKLAARLAVLEAQTQVVDVPAIDWSWPPEELNSVLRAVFDRIEVSPAGQIRAKWLVPEWRSNAAAAMRDAALSD